MPILDDPGLAQIQFIHSRKKQAAAVKNLFANEKGKDGSHSHPFSTWHSVGTVCWSIHYGHSNIIKYLKTT